MKNNNVKINTTNLLESDQFKTALQFEADYASGIKGGSLPNYIATSTRRRLVSSVNLLNEVEQLELIHSIFIGKN